MQKYYQNEPTKNNLSKIKDGEYVINLDVYKSLGTHWVDLYEIEDNESASYDATYFDSF